MAMVEVQVPHIGDLDEVAVIELMVKVGDTVKAEQSLITVESDKASMEIPSSTAGVVKEIKVKLGDKVKQGSVVLVLEAEGGGVTSSGNLDASGKNPGETGGTVKVLGKEVAIADGATIDVSGDAGGTSKRVVLGRQWRGGVGIGRDTRVEQVDLARRAQRLAADGPTAAELARARAGARAADEQHQDRQDEHAARRVGGEGVHRRQHARAHEEGAEQRQRERDDREQRRRQRA